MDDLKLVAKLLEYPETWWNELDELLNKDLPSDIREFLKKASSYDLLDLEEEYVSTFDLNKNITLNVTYYLTEDTKRGKYMLLFLERLGKPVKDLPDYLPFVLSRLSENRDKEIISLIKKPLEVIINNLRESNSIFLPLFIHVYNSLYGDEPRLMQ